MKKGGLIYLTILSSEHEYANKINFNNVIDNYAEVKAWKSIETVMLLFITTTHTCFFFQKMLT